MIASNFRRIALAQGCLPEPVPTDGGRPAAAGTDRSETCRRERPAVGGAEQRPQADHRREQRMA